MPRVPSSPVAKPASPARPVQFSAQECPPFILPPLSRPQRGPQGKLGYPKPFTSLLKVLYTGRQWKELPMDNGPEGKAELPYSGVFKRFARWAEEGSLERAFLASGQPLAEAQKLDRSLLPGDGANTGAQKGGRAWAPGAPNTPKARKCLL